MKRFNDRLIEILKRNIDNNFYFKNSEDNILQLIDYLRTNKLVDNYEENEEIVEFLENPNKYYQDNL